jgi:hypothetical protein
MLPILHSVVSRKNTIYRSRYEAVSSPIKKLKNQPFSIVMGGPVFKLIEKIVV